MPGYELWSDKERKEVNDVLNTGILMRYGSMDLARVFGKAKNWNRPFATHLDVSMHNLHPVVLPH
jgi:8-amino-3,8-dideoxy-alpha-D-manno-octulosonate transaminase